MKFPRFTMALLLAFGAGTFVHAEDKVLASSTTQLSHTVNGGGLELLVPDAVLLAPEQTIERQGDIAHLPALAINTFELAVLDKRGTLSPITVRATLEPLRNGDFVRETTVTARNVAGPNAEGVTARSLSATDTLILENFIDALPLYNRSFTAEIAVQASALDAQSIASGVYAGHIFFEVE